MSITETLHLEEFLATLDEFLVHRVEPTQEAELCSSEIRALHLWGSCPSPEWHDEGEACHCGPFSEYSEGGDQ